MKFAVLVFPGSNCDHDCEWVLGSVLKQKVEMVWHQNEKLPSGIDCVIVPGGFSYGDYLRCGAIARFSPIMNEVVRYAARGGLVWGICNGFQILTEIGLLPGALIRNVSLKFICQTVNLKAEHTDSIFTRSLGSRRFLKIPIAHGEGNYTCDAKTLKQLEDTGRVLFRYCDSRGRVVPEANPNGSIANIAGILNTQGNVLGMMPHPERVSEAVLGGQDGRLLFESVLNKITSV
jgi:phosphoribosylformylglycinamidine synthase subunit PurQ / glutaminase